MFLSHTGRASRLRPREIGTLCSHSPLQRGLQRPVPLTLRLHRSSSGGGGRSGLYDGFTEWVRDSFRHFRRRDGSATAHPSKLALKELAPWFRPELPTLGLAAGALIISSGANLAFPLALGQLVDGLVPPAKYRDGAKGSDGPESPSYLELYGHRSLLAALFGLFLVGSAATFVRHTALKIVSERVSARIRSQLFETLARKPISFHDQTRTGEVISRMSSDCSTMSSACTETVSYGTRSLVSALGGTMLLLTLSPKLSTLVLAIVPPLGIFGIVYGRYVRKLQREVQERLASANTIAEERINNIKTVRAFGAEDQEARAYTSAIDESFLMARRQAVASGVFMGTVSLGLNVSLLAVLGLGGSLVSDGLLSAGDLTSFGLYAVGVGGGVAGVMQAFTTGSKAIGSAERVLELLREPAERGTTASGALAEASANVPALTEPSAAIAFSGVRFAYPTRESVEVLRSVDLSVHPGQSVAIVGASGSGKSTLISLLERFYEANEGIVSIEGKDVREWDDDALRSHLGLVEQEPTLFACSIAENIRYGSPDLPMEAVVDAAKKANAHSFIAGFPEGYATLVGEKGAQLSGGQKQRIAIARAIARDPRVMLLDEATSALDSESEHAVQMVLRDLMATRTTVVIAHRLATVMGADKIIVLSAGRVAEEGTHAELMTKGGIYSSLVKTQLVPNA